MSTESPKKSRSTMFSGLTSLFRISTKTSRRNSKALIEPDRPPSTRSSLKTEDKSEAPTPTQISPSIKPRKKHVVFSENLVSSSDDYEYPIPLQKIQSYDSAGNRPQKKGILVQKRRYSQQIDLSNNSSKTPQNWVGLLIPEDNNEDGNKEEEDDDDEEEDIIHYTFKHSPHVELGLKKTFGHAYPRHRSDSADKGFMTKDILDQIDSPQKLSSNSKKSNHSLFKPIKADREILESIKAPSKKEQLSPIKVNGEQKSHFTFGGRAVATPSTENRQVFFNISTPKVEDQNMQKAFNFGYLPEVRVRDAPAQIKTDRHDYDRGLYGENLFGSPPSKTHAKSNSGFDSSRTNFAFTASSILKPEQYPGVYHSPSGQRLNIVPGYQGALPNSYAGTPRKF